MNHKREALNSKTGKTISYLMVNAMLLLCSVTILPKVIEKASSKLYKASLTKHEND